MRDGSSYPLQSRSLGAVAKCSSRPRCRGSEPRAAHVIQTRLTHLQGEGTHARPPGQHGDLCLRNRVECNIEGGHAQAHCDRNRARQQGSPTLPPVRPLPPHTHHIAHSLQSCGQAACAHVPCRLLAQDVLPSFHAPPCDRVSEVAAEAVCGGRRAGAVRHMSGERKLPTHRRPPLSYWQVSRPGG